MRGRESLADGVIEKGKSSSRQETPDPPTV